MNGYLMRRVPSLLPDLRKYYEVPLLLFFFLNVVYFCHLGEDLNSESCSRLRVEALCETVSVTQTDSEVPCSIQILTFNESE